MAINNRILKVMTSEVNMRKFIDEAPTTLFLGFKARPLTGSFILAYRANWLNDHILPDINVSYEGSENILLINHHNLGMITESAFSAYLVARFHAGRFIPLVEPEYYLNAMHSSTLATKMRDLTGFWFSKEGHHLVVNSRMHDKSYRYTKPASVMFNYYTGKPYGSAVPIDEEFIPIPEVRRQWLRDVKKLKRSLKTLYRLGVIQAELDKSYDTPGMTNGYEVCNRVVERMKAGECLTPREAREMHLYHVLGMIPLSGMHRWTFKPSTHSDIVDAFFTKESKRLREIYGVFGHIKDLD